MTGAALELHGVGLDREARVLLDSIEWVVRPDERLHTPNMLGLGAQHVLAMFGASALVPVLTGFPVTTTVFFSGIGTILFNLIINPLQIATLRWRRL